MAFCGKCDDSKGRLHISIDDDNDPVVFSPSPVSNKAAEGASFDSRSKGRKGRRLRKKYQTVGSDEDSLPISSFYKNKASGRASDQEMDNSVDNGAGDAGKDGGVTMTDYTDNEKWVSRCLFPTQTIQMHSKEAELSNSLLGPCNGLDVSDVKNLKSKGNGEENEPYQDHPDDKETETMVKILPSAEVCQGQDEKPKASDNTKGVWIDTNLDTHLVTIVYDNDTVSELKKRIKSDHLSLFPKFGHIHIDAIKVKCERGFYFLTDSLSMRNAFNVFNKTWFLSVDPSRTASDQEVDYSVDKGAGDAGRETETMVKILPSAEVCQGQDEKPKASDNTKGVWIDTNLDTHLVTVVYDNDTVSELKKRIKSDHLSLFPKFGHIHIDAIKVKCERDFYFLTDSLSVRNAFNVFNKTWFLSVDPSGRASDQEVDYSVDKGAGDAGRETETMVKILPSAEVCQGQDEKPKKKRKACSKEGTFVIAYRNKPPDENNKQDTVNEDVMISAIPALPSCEMDRDKKTKSKKKEKENKDSHLEGNNGCHEDIIQDDKGDPKESDNLIHKIPEEKEHYKPTDEKTVDDGALDFPDGNQSKDRKIKKRKKKSRSQGGVVNSDMPVSVEQSNEMLKEDGNKIADAKPSQVRTLSDGLVIHELETGTKDGKIAALGKKISINYTGKLKESGAVFESNADQAPFKFRLGKGKVIKGWDAGLEGMRVGEKRRVVIPPSMGEAELSNNLVGLCNGLDVGDVKKKKSKGNEEENEPYQYNPDDKKTETMVKILPSAEVCHGQDEKPKASDNTHRVFIDTNLDTHLLTVVNDNDPVSNLIERIKLEHLSLFPKFGHIHIDAIKIKHEGCFYSLADSMCMRDAFNGFNETWLLSVEASSLGDGAKSDQLIPHDLSKSGPSAKTKWKSKRKRENTCIKELNVSSKVMDVSGMNEPVKSKKKKRRTRKAKNSGRELTHRDGIDLLDGSKGETIVNSLSKKKKKRTRKAKNSGRVLTHRDGIDLLDASKSETVVNSLKATNCDPMSRNSAVEENSLSQPEGGENQQEDMQQIVLWVAGKEDDFGMDSAGQTAGVEEGRGQSTENDPNLEKATLFKKDNTNANIKELNVGGVVSKDYSDRTSEDEFDNSDVSTRTPSSSSFMSDSSDADSSGDLDSQHVASGEGRMENGGGSSLEASLPATNGNAFELLFRRSSMYKKALIAASQLDEIESQPVFFPDSLADT